MKELETLPAFLARTAGFTLDSLPHDRGLQTSINLPLKVGSDGKMKPFMGNTVVFPLPEEAKRELGRMQRRLYQTCAPALAEPLETSSLHMTLHDLLSGKPDQNLCGRINDTRDTALERVRQIMQTGETVRLHSTALFNMVNTSKVLGFAPADEESCARLMTYYEILQEAICLDYPLTPHVTLAYFRPGTVAAEWVEELRGVVDEVGRRERIVMELPAAALEYQLFSEMNHYWRDM